MKQTLLLLAFATIITACKKENAQKSQPEIPNETFPEWVTYHTSNSLLPSDQVNAITVSNKNVKWMATANGLACLEGMKWSVYNTSNSPLPSNNIQTVAVEVNGTLWIGTDKGLVSYNGKDWKVYDTGNSVLTDDRIKCITHDALYNVTWVGTEDGLIKISKDKWEYIEQYQTILSMTTDHKGALWMGVFNDFAFIGMIKRYLNGQWTTYRLDQLGYTSAFPYDISIDQYDRPVAVLAGTVVKAAIRFDGTNWTEIDRPDKARGFRAVLLQGDEVWVGGSTLSCFGAKDKPLVDVPVKDLYISDMAADANGRKWISTYSSGVIVYSPAVK
jgi:ligand-binding sensor domain-containing protein